MTRLATTRPKAVLGGWLGLLALLAVIGLDVNSRVTPTTILLPDSEAGRAAAMADDAFGERASMSILLQGPPRHVQRQGRALVRDIRGRLGVRVLSPFGSDAAAAALRPRGDRALILLEVPHGPNDAIYDLAPRVRQFVDARIERPVRPSFVGEAFAGDALVDASVESTRQAELVALPVLVIVLLLVFRSVFAAAIPGLFGAATVLAGFGVVSLLTRVAALDATAISLLSMMGLALGVDYSLLMVSRFREALAEGSDERAAAAAAVTAATAGRTVVFAGVVLTVGMLATLFLAPSSVLFSTAVGVITVAVISVGSAIVALPALFTLLGSRIERYRLPARRRVRSLPLLAGSVARRPALAALLVLIPIGLLAAPAAALRTGPTASELLPEDNPLRRDTERVAKSVGGGWTAPFEVVMKSRRGPITERKQLKAIRRFQRSVAEDDRVRFVGGPGNVDRGLAQLREAPGELRRARRTLRDGRRDLAEFDEGLASADDGVDELVAGLSEAISVSRRAGAGAGRAADGAAALSGGGQEAVDAAHRLTEGLERAQAGLAELRSGTARARGLR
ncbi:MAG TPA: MMPL family transporter [Solirubrobacteraceae bacterium]|nr:MMPL family transporter [Solirubrobacteraceae bacterium]